MSYIEPVKLKEDQIEEEPDPEAQLFINVSRLERIL